MARSDRYMIDFRYHLVSLVSVFLALAVGIVLGAGPLKDPISDTLTTRVEQLRQEKDTLRANLDTANTGLAHRDAIITDVTPALVQGQLTGRQIVLVLLPGVSSDDITPLVDAIGAAGGTVTGQVTVGTAWTDAGKAGDRSALAATLAESVPASAGGGSAASGDTSTQLARFLSAALVTTGPGAVGRASSDSSTVMKNLQDADLVSVKGDLSGQAGAALMMVPSNDGALGGSLKPTPSTQDDAAYLELAAALDNAGGGAVVTGPSSSALSGGMLTAIRAVKQATSRISTVDSGSTPMGVVAAILALREQMSGGVGQYGFQDGASDELPSLSALGATPAASAAAG
jgi:hypothetical protein